MPCVHTTFLAAIGSHPGAPTSRPSNFVMDILAALLLAAAVFAQAPEVTTANALFAYGPMGIILCWFMFRGEAALKEIRGLGNRIDGLTRAMLVDVLSRDNAGTHTRETAQAMLTKLESRPTRD